MLKAAGAERGRVASLQPQQQQRHRHSASQPTEHSASCTLPVCMCPRSLTMGCAVLHAVAAARWEWERRQWRAGGRPCASDGRLLHRHTQQQQAATNDSNNSVLQDKQNGIGVVCGSPLLVENENDKRRLRGRDFCPRLSEMLPASSPAAFPPLPQPVAALPSPGAPHVRCGAAFCACALCAALTSVSIAHVCCLAPYLT